MTNKIKWIKNIFLTAGVIEVAAGLLHFFMLYFLYQSAGFSLLHPSEIDFVTMGVLAIGILLLAFGSLTIVFSSQIVTNLEISFSYAVIKSVLWLGRSMLEIIFPVQLRLFLIEPFTVVALPLVVIEMGLFVVSAIWIKNIMNGVNQNVD